MQAITLSSAQNPKIKKLLALQQKSSERRREQLFVVEGMREWRHCQAAGFQIDSIFCCPQLLCEKDIEALSASLPHPDRLISVSPELYNRIAYRGSTEGIIALVHERHLTLSDLTLKNNPLIVVLERVEKSGNIGAILRSADAAGADAVIICDPLTDLYNPNLIRSSIGAIFTVPCLATTTEECITFLKNNHIRILTAQLQDSSLYYDTNMTQGTAIILGTEATGLTDTWRQVADAHIRIPMLGQLDSLNVSVSAAILLYEAVRQRQGLPTNR